MHSLCTSQLPWCRWQPSRWQPDTPLTVTRSQQADTGKYRGHYRCRFVRRLGLAGNVVRLVQLAVFGTRSLRDLGGTVRIGHKLSGRILAGLSGCGGVCTRKGLVRFIERGEAITSFVTGVAQTRGSVLGGTEAQRVLTAARAGGGDRHPGRRALGRVGRVHDVSHASDRIDGVVGGNFVCAFGLCPDFCACFCRK
jgi:hypothetical protein